MNRLFQILLIIILSLVTVSNVFAVDSLLCLDTDKNGTFSIIKDSGEFDRDCDHNASVVDGGTDCDDTRPEIFDGGYTTIGCSAGEYHYCEGGVFKTKPGGSTAANGCTSADISEKTNKYFVSGTGSGTACTAGSPCAISAVSSGGSVPIVSPAQVVFVGNTDITPSQGFFTTVSGSSSSNRNLWLQDPRSTAKINITGGSCAGSCASIKIQANNWDVKGVHVEGGDATGSGGIRADGDFVNIQGNRLYDIQCENSFNCASIYVGENLETVSVKNNILMDVGDPDLILNSDVRQNTWLIGAFRNRNLHIEGNSLGYSHSANTAPFWKQGGGMRIKHGKTRFDCNAGAKSFMSFNVVGNTEYEGVRTNSGCVTMDGNLFLNVSHGAGLGPEDSVAWHEIELANNTFVMNKHWQTYYEVGGAISLSEAGGTGDLTMGGVIIKDNVINDSATTAYAGGNYVHLVSNYPYGSDASYNRIIAPSATFTAGTDDVITHGTVVANLARMRLISTGTLPGGLTTATNYWAIYQSATTFKLANSYANAVAGTAIDITSIGSGTHTLTAPIADFLGNCYYNSNFVGLANGFNFYGDAGAGALGSITNFAGAQSSPYFFEIGSTNGNPGLDNEYRVTGVCPIGIVGWEGLWPGIVIPTPTPTPTPTATPVPGSIARGRMLRR